MVERLGDLDLNEFLSVKTLLVTEVPGAAEDVFINVKDLASRHPKITGALLGATPFIFSVLPQQLFAADSLQASKMAVSTERIGDLVKTLALPAILGIGNAYRAWYSTSQDVERIQNQINNAVDETNAAANIQSVDDIIWRTVAAQLNYDLDASPEERETVLTRQNSGILEKLRASAEEEFKTIPETVAGLTAGIKEMSNKRDKIWRRGAWRIPFEFGEGFLVGCFGMALLQPDGAPTVVDKFFNSADSVEQTQNGLYLSGYAFASWTALRAMWKLQHAAGGRGRARDEAMAHQKRVILDSGEDIKGKKKSKLSDQAKAMAGDRIAQAKVRIKGN